MRNAISYELYKLRKQKHLWISIIILILLNFILLGSLAIYTKDILQKQATVMALKFITNTPSLFIIVAASITVCDPFHNKTIRLSASRGISRLNIVLANKLVVYWTALAYFFVGLIFSIVAYIISGKAAEANNLLPKLIEAYFFTLIQILNYVALFTMVAFLVRKTSYSICISIGITFILAILLTVSNIGRLINHNDVIPWYSLLLPNSLNQITNISSNATIINKLTFTLAMLVETAIYSLVSIFSFKIRDI